jgi:acyl carrier protein
MLADRDSATEQRVRAILAQVKNREVDAELDTPLYAEGIELDSLETAEFSALLEAELGADPWAGDVMPESIGDILAFFSMQAAPPEPTRDAGRE